MLFDDWCDQEHIHRFREAFYHHLCAALGASAHDADLTEDILKKEWLEFLGHALKTI